MLRHYFLRRSVLSLAVALLFLPTLTAQTTFTVTSTDDSGPGTLRQAVADAQDGDNIVFDASTDDQTIELEELIVIEDKNLTITGNGMEETILSGRGQNRIFAIRGDSEAVIESLKITDGQAQQGGGVRVRALATLTLNSVHIHQCVATATRNDRGGGGIRNTGVLTLNNCFLQDNRALNGSASGGGILNAEDGTLTINNSRLYWNMAARAGGGIEDRSGAATTFTITDSELGSNKAGDAPGNGGAVHITGDGNLTITNCDIEDNQASSEGGGLWNDTGIMTVRNCFIDNNVAMGNAATNGGGGLFNNGGTLDVGMNTMLSNNRATGTSGSGGAIFNEVGGTLLVDNTMIIDNQANRAGGGIEDNSGATTTVELTNTRISENTVFNNPGNGGGVHISGNGDMDITNGTITFNTAGSEGGGLWNSVGTMTIRDTEIDDNIAMGDDATNGGGGVFNNGGTVDIASSLITENLATGTAGSGGGIFNAAGGTLLVDTTIIADNTANRAGGGIEDASGLASAFTVTRSRIFENEAISGPGNGGGIHISGDGNATISQTNFSKNVAAAEGGALWNSTGVMTVTGGVISKNVAMGNAADNGGGGVFNNGGAMVIDGVDIRENEATGTGGSGGGLFSTDGTVNVIGGMFRDNVSNRAGGAVEIVDGTYESDQTDYMDNSTGAAPGNGGALHVTGTNATVVTITGGTMTRNEAANEGGALWNQVGSIMTVAQVDVLNNSVTGTGSSGAVVAGGGLYNNGGTVEVIMSTIARNSVNGGSFSSGGGVANVEGGTVDLSNSTIAENTTDGSGGGVANAGTVTLQNVSMAGNSASVGGGYAQVNTATLTIGGTAISDNSGTTSDNDFVNSGGMVNSNGFNLISDDSGNMFPAESSDKEGMSANFGALADNGGTTLTLMPDCPSPVIDMADPGNMDDDQIGQSVFGGRRDIGAFERQSACSSSRPVAGRANAGSAGRYEGDVSIYPNPTATDHINVRFGDELNGEVTLHIIDGAGRVRSTYTTESTRKRLPLYGLNSGAYILQVVDADKTRNLRFTVTK